MYIHMQHKSVIRQPVIGKRYETRDLVLILDLVPSDSAPSNVKLEFSRQKFQGYKEKTLGLTSKKKGIENFQETRPI